MTDDQPDDTEASVYGIYLEINPLEEGAAEISEALREAGFQVHRVTRLDAPGLPDD